VTEVVTHNGWARRRLRDAVTKLVDGSHNPPPKQDRGRPMLSARNVDQGQIIFDDFRYISDDSFETEHARTRVSPGDVLLTIVGTIGRSAVVPDGLEPFALQRSVAVLAPKEDLLPKFLAYQLQSPRIQRHFEEHARGTAQKGVYLKTLGETPLVIPPINEQHAIVAEIEKQFSRLDEAVANLKRYKAAVLKAAVEGRLVPTEAELARCEARCYETAKELLSRILQSRRDGWKGRGKYKEPAAAAGSVEVPEGWACASVDQLLAYVTDGDHQPPPQTASGIPFIVIGDVRSGEIDFSDTRFVSADYYASLESLRRPQEGDLLYTLVGSYGIPVRVTTSEAFCVQRHMAILRPHSLSPMEYLAVAMSSKFLFRQATEVATGTAQLTVPLAGLRRISVPLPPLDEQQRIVAEVDRRLSIVREVEAEVHANLKRAQALRQAVLAKAFAA
jgi:type I restriction enzyme S subunit